MSNELINAIIDAIVAAADTPNQARTIAACQKIVDIFETERKADD